MVMTHPGLPWEWVMLVLALMFGLTLWGMTAKRRSSESAYINFNQIPLVGDFFSFISRSPIILISLKLLMVGLFILIIAAGFWGTAIPERNLATVFTWNIWWAGLIIVIFFIGSAWCAVCPWDTLSNWFVRRRWWKRATPNNSLNLKPPKILRSVYPALLMFIGLTWLELGFGVTVDPYITALLALIMVVLATLSLAIFQRKSFCHYFCPVGRTIGFYSQLALSKLRPVDNDVCAKCTTLECYHGSEDIDPCPTQLVMGSLQQNTYCTSCGNCVQSCPHQNVGWRLVSPSEEATQNARPHMDEAWFMLGLLALTGFHGITMMTFWETWLTDFAQFLGDQGKLLWTFSVGLSVDLLLVALLYFCMIILFNGLSPIKLGLKKTFTSFAFMSLPIAFSYHIAHNLNHIIRESSDLLGLLKNPLGIDTLPLTMMEKHMRHMDMLISQDSLFLIQAVVMILGFWGAVLVIRQRSLVMIETIHWSTGWRLLPIYGFAMMMTGFHLWMMYQPMTMRM
jgi:polyferredoxin